LLFSILFNPQSVLAQCETIGGEVWVDTDNNGCQDPGETTMVANATINIWECDPNTGSPFAIIGSTSTGTDGAWNFGFPNTGSGSGSGSGTCALDPSKLYASEIIIPNGVGEAYEGYSFSTGIADGSCTAGQDDNVDPATGISENCYNPLNTDAVDGDTDENIDAGI